jgi:hypothetical protein
VALLTLLLCTVFGTALFTTLDTLEIQSTTDDVITHTWKIWNTTTTDKHDSVLLEVVAFATDVGPNFLAVSKAHTSNLTKSGVRFLWSLGSNLDTDTTLEWGWLVIITSLQGINNGT